MPRRDPSLPPRELRDLTGTIGRARKMAQIIAAIILLRTGRWTVRELAAELGTNLSVAYRLIRTMRRCGITVEVSREGNQGYYVIPAEPLRKLLRL